MDKKRFRTAKVSAAGVCLATGLLMPVSVYADVLMDDAVETANKSVSAPAALIMFVALLVMCIVVKKMKNRR